MINQSFPYEFKAKNGTIKTSYLFSNDNFTLGGDGTNIWLLIDLDRYQKLEPCRLTIPFTKQVLNLTKNPIEEIVQNNIEQYIKDMGDE